MSNITLNPATVGGGPAVATDVHGGDHYQINKVAGNRAGLWPGYSGAADTFPAPVLVDDDGNLMTRAAVLTDEGTFRVNFANTSLAVSIGAVSVSGAVVTGTGFLTADVHYKDYFKLDADGESAWVQIESIDSDTNMVLRTAYTGGTSGAASRTLMRPVTGSGGSIAVASGACTVGSGTTVNAITRVTRNVDYGPLVFRARTTISQRIANQTWRIGLSEAFTTADRYFARFRVEGTTATTVICETGRNPTVAPSAPETETTTITLPNGLTTAASLEYRVELLTERVVFYINGGQVAEHTRVIPAQHDEMEGSVSCINGGTAPASNTNAVIDYITVKNHNKLEIGVMSDAEKIVASAAPLVPFTYNVAGVIAINTDLLVIDCRQLRTVNLQATSIGTTGRLDFFLTNDMSVVGTAQPAYPIGGGAAVTTTTAAGHWVIPTGGAAFLRVRLGVATTAGTTTLFAQGSQDAHPLPVPATQTISGTLTANQGTMVALPTGANLAADVGLQVRANATGAASTSHLVSAATTNTGNVKASAGRLLGWSAVNTTASFQYVKLHNNAGTPTAGAGVVLTIAIPPNGVNNCPPTLPGIAFTTGIARSIVTGSADADTTATTVGSVVLDLFFA
jgi:hypothetical protein